MLTLVKYLVISYLVGRVANNFIKNFNHYIMYRKRKSWKRRSKRKRGYRSKRKIRLSRGGYRM